MKNLDLPKTQATKLVLSLSRFLAIQSLALLSAVAQTPYAFAKAENGGSGVKSSETSDYSASASFASEQPGIEQFEIQASSAVAIPRAAWARARSSVQKTEANALRATSSASAEAAIENQRISFNNTTLPISVRLSLGYSLFSTDLNYNPDVYYAEASNLIEVTVAHFSSNDTFLHRYDWSKNEFYTNIDDPEIQESNPLAATFELTIQPGDYLTVRGNLSTHVSAEIYAGELGFATPSARCKFFVRVSEIPPGFGAIMTDGSDPSLAPDDPFDSPEVAVSVLDGSGFLITVPAPDTGFVILEESTDLVRWTPIGTTAAGRADYLKHLSAPFDSLYFRAKHD